MESEAYGSPRRIALVSETAVLDHTLWRELSERSEKGPRITEQGQRVLLSLQGLEDGTPDVLVDNGRLDIGDLGSLGQPVDHERIERVGVPHSDVQEEVVASCYHEQPDQLGECPGPVSETLDVGA